MPSLQRSRWLEQLGALTRQLHSLSGWRRYPLLIAVDATLVTLAFFLAYVLRFEGHVPAANVAQFWQFLPWLVAVRLASNYVFGLDHWSFRFSGLHEAGGLVLANLAGSAGFVSLLYFLQKKTEDVYLGPPRSVVAIEFLLATWLMGALRFSPRFAVTWLNEKRIARAGGRVRAVIVGAGSTGDLLLRDLRRSDEHRYEVVGFVDDDRAKRGASIGGRPVLGGIDELPEIVQRRGVEQLLFAIPRPPAELIRRVLGLCGELKLNYKTLPVSFAYLNDHASAALLQSLAPEDLLPRGEARFDPQEVKALVGGRRILVTGAAGSIGSEICRQLAAHGPAALVLADINENDLYFLHLELRRRFPQLDLSTEVVDIRDLARLEQLAARYRPQDVFHAAAHKHVPLMEWAPEEAVKNNVIGCRNVLTVAEQGGAERFVLISSDKAVAPSSVMGATKRIGELLIRSRAERSRTQLTAVRFGNVLGSSGSVVPIFKNQIAAGGPVTVTHPECRRFLMTIPEAVGLVVLAGLSRYGDLCILEMGEPMRILDLARLMISMAGLVPGKDIEIVFSGLRPGEKLDERLMTEDEERSSRVLRGTIRVVETPRPAPELEALVDALAERARAGDRQGVLDGIRAIVPSFTPSRASGPEPHLGLAAPASAAAAAGGAATRGLVSR